MKLKRTLVALALVFNTSLAFSANQPANLSGFDFNYQVDLNKSIGLTQVFDDGDRTYFQFTQSEILPTVHAIKNGKKVQIPLEVRPPYLIAAGVANKYVLSANNGKNSIYVSYNGNRAEETAQDKKTAEAEVSKDVVKDSTAKEANKETSKSTTAANEETKNIKASKASKKVAKHKAAVDEEAGDVKNDKQKEIITGSLFNIPFFENSITLSKKAKEDLIKSIPTISSASRIVVRGRPSVKGDTNIAGTRALVIKNFLVDQGVDESTIETTEEDAVKAGKNQGFYVSEVILLSGDAKTDKKVAVKKAPVDTSLNIKAGELISAQLSAWAKRCYNHTLQWEADEYRATAPLTLNTGFNETLEAVAGAMKINGINLDVTTYENHIIRVVEIK